MLAPFTPITSETSRTVRVSTARAWVEGERSRAEPEGDEPLTIGRCGGQRLQKAAFHEPRVIGGTIHVPQGIELMPAPAETAQPRARFVHDVTTAPVHPIEKMFVTAAHANQRVSGIRLRRNFGKAASEAGVWRIIYLGGLGDASTDLSSHLRSRQETGAALR